VTVPQNPVAAFYQVGGLLVPSTEREIYISVKKRSGRRPKVNDIPIISQ
jgi:hypothetical protein